MNIKLKESPLFLSGHLGELAILIRIIKLCLKYKKLIILGILGVIGVIASQLWIPFLLGTSIDTVYSEIRTGGDDFSPLWILSIYIILASVLRGVFHFVLQYNGEKIANAMSAELRSKFHHKLQSQTYKYHDRIHSGNLMSRGIMDIEGVKMFVTTGLLRTFEIVSLMVAGSFLLLRTDLHIGLLSLLFIIPVGGIASVTRLQLRKTWVRIQEEFSKLNTNLQENLIGVRVVRAFGGEDHEVSKFNASHDDVTKDTIKSVKISANGTSIMGFCFLLVWALLIWIGGHKVIDGTLSIGQLTQCLIYLGMLQRPVRMMGFMVNAYARAITCGLRLFEILDSKPRISNNGKKNHISKIEKVSFEKVSFKYYRNAKEYDLNQFSLTLEPGKIVGIIGPPGGGKSTVANLIPRFYDILGGELKINGESVKNFNLTDLRNRIGLVVQHTFLFNNTLGENIAYAKPDTSLDKIIEVAKIAEIHDFINSLPNRYDTMVGEFGVSLSGGQKQRIAIARNLMKDPDLLIFDDSFNALDTGTDKKIRSKLLPLQKEKATLIISQRVSTISHCDEIIVLDEGNVVDRGKHNILASKPGIYKDIYELQNPKIQGQGLQVS